MDFMTDFWKALGGKGGDLAKRFSSAHRGGVMKVAGHLGKAMGFHKVAATHHIAEHKAAAESMEECAKALEHVGKAHELHKSCEHCKKAVGAESNINPHAEINGHLEAAKAAVMKMASKMGEMSEAHKAAHGAMSETHDQHELAKGAIQKVASSWVGEESESPSAAGPGYDPAQAGHTSNMPQSTVSEGDVPDTDPFNPMYEFKGAGIRGGGHVTEAEAKLREDNARLQGELNATKKALETMGNQPAAAPGARIFAPANGVSGATEPARGSVDSLIKDARAKGIITDVEMQQWATNPDNAELRERITRKILGHQASAIERGDGSFAKTLTDRAFRGDNAAINQETHRTSAAGVGVFRTV